MGEFEKAIDYYKKDLNILKHVFGEKHPDTATSYYNIGLAYHDLEEFAMALEYALKALAIREDALGVEHCETTDSYYNVGVTYESLGEYDKALEYMLKAYKISKEANRDEETGIYLNGLGKVYALMGDKEMAKMKFEEAVSLLSEDHPDAIDSKERLTELDNIN